MEACTCEKMVKKESGSSVFHLTGFKSSRQELLYKKGETMEMLNGFFNIGLLNPAETAEMIRFALLVVLDQNSESKVHLDNVIQFMFSFHAGIPKIPKIFKYMSIFPMPRPTGVQDNLKLWTWTFRCAAETFFESLSPRFVETLAKESSIPKELVEDIVSRVETWRLHNDITPVVAAVIRKFRENLTKSRMEACRTFSMSIGLFLLRWQDELGKEPFRVWLGSEDATYDEKQHELDMIAPPKTPTSIQQLCSTEYVSNVHLCAHVEAECMVRMPDGRTKHKIGTRYISIVSIAVQTLANLIFHPEEATRILQSLTPIQEFVSAWKKSFEDEHSAARTICNVVHNVSQYISTLIRVAAETKLGIHCKPLEGLMARYCTVVAQKREIINPSF